MRREFILTLLNIPNCGRVKSKTIIDNINHNVENITQLYNGIIELKSKYPKLKIPTFEVLEIAYSNAMKIIETSLKNNIQITSYFDSIYSKNLLQTTDFPLIIYSKGNLELFDANPKVAVIGTRKPTDLGIKLGSRITEILVKHNFIIVSGLALGCDTIAHQTCLDNNGKTIAVLAGGLNDIYPKINLKLSYDIIESGGLLISEYPFGITPRANYFVERNRIQSGISIGVCVIETEISSGTMHTVKFAKQQNKLVGCIEHPKDYQHLKEASGNRILISQNQAIALGNINEISDFIDEIKKMK
jgi:DNA processing protein